MNHKGLQARDIAVEQSAPIYHSHDWLAQAILARDNRKYDEAAALYEKGLTQSPSAHLVFSYAAMEKIEIAKQRRCEYTRKESNSLTTTRSSTKTLSLDSLANIQKPFLLKHALDLCRNSNQRGEKGVLLALARTHYDIDTMASLRESIRFYQEALHLFGRGRTQLPEINLLAMNLAKIRIQHHRGN